MKKKKNNFCVVNDLWKMFAKKREHASDQTGRKK